VDVSRSRRTTDEVRAELTAADVIREYGLRGKPRGSQFRLRECPRCHEKSRREAIAIDTKTGRWLHHGHERDAGGVCSGDVFDLIAACEGLDCRRDFVAIMDRAKSIAGIDHVDEPQRERRKRQAEARAAEQTIADLERLIANRSTASSTWNTFLRFEGRGMRYLASRGLDAGKLVDADAVRFAADGAVVAIRDPEGNPVNVARRLYEPTFTKVMTMKDHSTRGTMIGAVASIYGECDVIVTEGVMDSLTARCAWPLAVVLGANGAGNLPKVVESAIARIKLAGARLSICPHDDEPGHRSAIRAGQIALAAGIEPQIVEYHGNDLNEAWQKGWRP
jgi:hypothetical protein